MKIINRLRKPAAVAMFSLMAFSAQAAETFRLAWSLYPANMAWDYAAREGIVDKWAKKYGIELEVVQINDYVEAINQYSAGAFDGCLMATMDALTIPAAAGVDSTVLGITDYSNGNDVIIIKNGESVSDLKGKRVNVIEFSISHYFLAKALEAVGLSERDITLVNTSDADMVALFAQPSVQAMVTWNPMAAAVLEHDEARNVLDSRKMPGELTDSIVVNTKVLKENPNLGKVIIGAWFETLAIMKRDDEVGRQAREAMGIAAGTDLAGFEEQLAATYIYDQADEVTALMAGAELQQSMASISEFAFEKGLLGSGATSAGAIGIEYPQGKVWGDASNVKLRFDNRFVEMAAKGEL